MEIVTPESKAYYYECSNGRFRLNYYLSFEMLEKLVKENKIKPNVIKDYPDGYDLDCTIEDFEDFSRTYKYVHSISPELLCQTFKSIFTSTKGWKTFKGSGWIPADILESKTNLVSKEISKTMKKSKIGIEINTIGPNVNLNSIKSKSLQLDDQLDRLIEKLDLEIVDPKKNLYEQFPNLLKMKENTVSAQEFFNQLSKNKHS